MKPEVGGSFRLNDVVEPQPFNYSIIPVHTLLKGSADWEILWSHLNSYVRILVDCAVFANLRGSNFVDVLVFSYSKITNFFRISFC